MKNTLVMLLISTLSLAVVADADQTCRCSQIQALQSELRQAEAHRVEHLGEARELRQKFPGEKARSQQARDAYSNWARSLGTAVSTSTSGKKSSNRAYAYFSVGEAELGDFRVRSTDDGRDVFIPIKGKFEFREEQWKSNPRNAHRNLCDRSDELVFQAFAKSGSACSAITQATIDHENLLSAALRAILNDHEHTKIVSGMDTGTVQSLLGIVAQCRGGWKVMAYDFPNLTGKAIWTGNSGVSCGGEQGPWHIVSYNGYSPGMVEQTFDVVLDESWQGTYKMKSRQLMTGAVVLTGTSSGRAWMKVAGDERDLWFAAAPVTWRAGNQQYTDNGERGDSSFRLVRAVAECQ